MMKKTILSLALCMAVILTAEEVVTFGEYVAEDGSGIEKLEKFQKEQSDKKEVYTTQDTLSDAWDQVELVTILLDQAVMKKVRKLPPDQGMVILKSHQLWWKYFDATPSAPNVNGSARGIYILATDFVRIESRWEAVKLPYPQYLTYAKIANLCQVRLDCGTYRMKFGEVCLKKEAAWAHDADEVKTFGKYYHSFPTSIIPESCLRDETIYAAVLRAYPSLYLCIWDQTGKPLAVHALKGMKKITSVSLEEGIVKVTGTGDGNATKTESFPANESNGVKIPTRRK